jgi:transketolase
MRTAFIEALSRLAEEDPRILLITGDLGFGVLNEYRERFPDQFANVGVAEQNMTGVGVGIALTGHTVFTYSIGNFPTLRPLEQVRNDACYHEADLKIVTVGGGMAYGALGPSHFATEDLAILRALPNMTVVAPGDPVEVEQLTPQIARTPGPVYLRLGRAGEERLHPEDAEIRLGEPSILRDGEDLLLLSTGGILPEVLEAAETLEAEGISARVVSVHTVRPLAGDALTAMAGEDPAVITCEEHSIIGGLGGAVAEVLMEAGVRTRFRRFGLEPRFPEGVGSQEYLRAVNGIAAADLVRLARDTVTG